MASIEELKQQLESLEVVGEDIAIVSMGEITGGTGSIDTTSLDTVIESIDAIEEAGIKSLVMDFSDIGYVVSAALGYLVTLCDDFTDSGGHAVIFGVQPKVAQILQVMGMINFLSISETRDEALARIANDA